MNKEISCLNTKAIVEYVRRHNGGDLRSLLEHLDPELDHQKDLEKFLTDPNNWVSSKVFSDLCLRAREIFHDDRIAFKIGFESISANRLGYIQRIFVRTMRHPRDGIHKAQIINDKFNRTKSIEIVENTHGRARVRLHWYPGLELNKDSCYINQGVYSAIATIWGIPPSEVVESCCFFEGGSYCQYTISWAKQSLLRGLWSWVFPQRHLLEEAVAEMEKDKVLLQKKYEEVYDLNVELKHRLDQLVSLQESSRAIVSILDAKKLLTSVMRLLTQTIGFERAILMLVDENKKVLRYAYGVGAEESIERAFRNYQIPMDRASNILVRVANTGIPAFIEDSTVAPLNRENPILKILKPKSFVIVPLISRNRIIGVLGADKGKSEARISQEDRDYLLSYANQIAVALDNAKLYHDINESYMSSIQSLALALEAKDSYTKGHSERVTRHATEIAKLLGLSETECERLGQMSMMHDIGKIGVPDMILVKPGKLSPHEWDLICRHTTVGAKIIDPLHLPKNEIAIIKSHHERIDGKGYPEGLTGDELPIEARIVSVADAFDAMTTDRPYRRALTLGATCQELRVNSGRQFDPEVARALLELVEDSHTAPSRVIPLHQHRFVRS